MSKSPIYLAIARQWEMLKLLPSHGSGISASELTSKLGERGFAVSKRTVERDLIDLSKPFGIRCNDQAMPYGWLWAEGCSFDLPGVDLSDALSLVLVEDLLGKLAPVSLQRALEPKFKQARAKLSSVQDNRYAQWKDRVRYAPPTLPFQPPKVEPRVLEVVKESIFEECQLEVRYSSAGDSRTRELTLHPLALVQQGPVAYLVATTFDYTEPVLYALHRFNSVRPTKAAARRPKGFSLDRFLERGGMQFGERGDIRLKAEVSSQLACYLTESPLANDQELIARTGGRYVLTATIKDSWQLQFWILSQGAEITVLQPKELRERVRAALRSALAGYSST